MAEATEAALATGLAVRSLDSLHESPDNPRSISDERFQALKYALDKDSEMLQARPIIAKPTGEVVAGNMRLRALVDLGWTEAPVFVANLSPAQAREWMLRDNQEYGDWVPEDLAALIAAHEAEQGDLAMLGFTDAAVEGLLKQAGDESGGGGGGSQGEVASAEVWGVVVECETEDEQAGLVEELADRGLEVRALIPS